MSEFSAIRNAIRAERQLVKDEQAVSNMRKIPPISDVLPKKPANVVKTAAGREVDISRGYNVRGPDGLKIPFNRDTPLEKAKQWTKNFYKPGEVEFQLDQSFGNRITLKNEPEGDSFLDYRQRADGTRRVVLSKTKKQGTGVGAGLYKALFDDAAKAGAKVESDTAMSQGSVNVWLRFKQLGYPIIEHPRKKMTNGGYENATSPNRPLFEYDPSKTPRAETKPVASASKAHNKVAGAVPKADTADQLIYDLRKQKGVPPETREKILDVYNDYKMAEDPVVKAELESQIKALLPKSESK